MNRVAGDALLRTETRRFYEDSFATLLAASPEVAAEIGVAQIGGRAIPQDRFSEVSPAGEQHRRALMADALARLARVPTSASDVGELDREVYEFFLRWGRFGRLLGTESHAFPLCDSIADHLCGVQTELITCLTQWQSLETSAHAQCFIDRLEAVPRQIDALMEALHERAAVGNVMPACIVRRVVDEIAELFALPLEQQPVYRRCAESGRVDPARIAGIVEHTFLPAFRRLHELFVGDYPHEDRIGLCRLRDGEGFYRFLLKAHTTTDMSVVDVHALGLEELQRLQQATSTKLRAAGYRGDSLGDLFAAFDRDERFRPFGDGPSGDELLNGVEALISETAMHVMPLLGIRPGASVTVRAIPEVQEANRHMTYVPPTPDGSRRGTFDVNLAQLRSCNRLDLYTLVYHEAIPGHHVQLTIAQELAADVPSFRRVLVHDGYIEGWAKYAELLPFLAGFNTDPAWDIARSRNELYSTANLALDTGIHAMGWSRQQGIAFFADNTCCTQAFAAGIVDRIVARPAQVCSYKIGMMAVLNARQRMERALGQRFDVRRFHDVILGQGSLPLALLDRVVDAEIGRLRQC